MKFNYYIDYDVGKVKELKERYEYTLQLTRELLPIDPSSTKQVKAFFKDELGVELKSTKIAEIEQYIDRYDHDSLQYDVINGIVLYLKMKYTLKNYVNCILRHEESGRIYLRDCQGKWLLPNKQPISRNPEINECVIHSNYKGEITMGAIASGTDGKNYENPEAGTYAARCIQVVELGTRDDTYPGNEGKKKKEVIIVFEIDELMEDGRPFVVNWWNTNSLNEKSNLYKMLTKWRGKQFTAEELKGFALSNILDKECMVSVIETKSGRMVVANDGVSKLPKGMKAPERQNPLVDFGITDLGKPVYDDVYPWMKTFIEKSDEYKVFEESGQGFTPDEDEDEEGRPF